MTTTKIEYVFFESAPFVDSYALPGSEPDRVADYVDVPPAFLDALGDLHDRRDSARCVRCDDSVGFVLTEHASGFGRLEWKPTGLAREGDGPVSPLCEQCTPELPSRP